MLRGKHSTELPREMIEVNGREYRPIGDGVAVRPVLPGESRPPEAHSLTPHPNKSARRQGYMMAWIFLSVVVCMFLGILVML